MKIFEDGRRVVVVTENGVLRGKVEHYNKARKSYTVISYYGILYNVKASHVYSKSDYGRASNFFEGRYL